MKENILPYIISKKEIDSHTNLEAALLGKFENSLLTIELFVFLVLTIASLINKDLTFGQNKSLTDSKYYIRFIIETILVGIGCAIPFIYMKYTRDYQNASVFNMIILFIFSFLFMAFVNLLFQFSGFYSYMYGINKVDKPKPSLKKGLIDSVLVSNAVIIGFLILQIIIISVMVRNIDIPAYNNHFFISFIIEVILFGLANSLPTLLITINRIGYISSASIIRLLISIVGFSALHVSLQISGFYKNLLGI
jgi:hypothetical protein